MQQFFFENLIYLLLAVLLGVSICGGIIFYRRQQKRSDAPEIHEAPTAAQTPRLPDLPQNDAAVSQRQEALETHEVPKTQETLATQEKSAAELLAVEVPESVPSRMQRLRARLAKSGGIGKSILAVLSRAQLSAQDWEEIEDTLLLADVGVSASAEILENLRQEIKVAGSSDPSIVQELLRKELLRAVQIDASRALNLTQETASGEKAPVAILMVGVNGTGKTTTTGKLARLLVAEEKEVILGAADTFRAAAAEQLQTWAQRVGVAVVRAEKEGADPASVAFEAVKKAREAQAQVVIVDTAGRLQNKAGLMDELSKIKRVMEKQAPVREVLLVLDATTGQNGLQQAKVFAEAVNVTGIVLSKLDGTAKGGIVISVQRELGVPVKFIGLGEGADDFAPFDPQNFVDALLADTQADTQ